MQLLDQLLGKHFMFLYCTFTLSRALAITEGSFKATLSCPVL